MTALEVSLRVWGDAPEVAELAALTVGTAWVRGDRVPGSPVMLRKEGGWEVFSALRSDRSLEDHVTSLLEATASVWPHLVHASKSGYVELSVAIYVSADPQPIARLTRAQLLSLAELGADIDLDIFNWTLVQE